MNCDPDRMEALKAWVQQTWATRTRAVKAGTTDMSWYIPESRVTFTEALWKAEELGVVMNPVDLRLAMDGWIK